MRTNTAGKRLGTVFRALIVVVVFLLIARQLDLAKAWQTVRCASPVAVGGAVALFLVNRVLTAAKWRILLRHCGVSVGLPPLVRIMFESAMLGVMVPSGLGVDIVRLVQLGRRERNLTAAAGSVLADRVLAVMTLAGLSVVAACLAWGLVDRPAVLVYVMAAGSAVVVLPLLCMGKASFRLYALLHDAVAGFLTGRVFPNRTGLRAFTDALRRKAEDIHGSFAGISKKPGLLMSVLAVNLAVQLVRIAQVHLLFVAVGYPVAFVFQLAFVPLILLLVLLPFCPYMGLGVKEAAFIYFFGRVGVPEEMAFSVSLLSHVVVIVGMIPGAVLFFANPARRGGNAGRPTGS